MAQVRLSYVAATGESSCDFRAYAEKRMRDVVYNYGGYNGQYVAFYPNGTVKDGRVVKSPVGDTVDVQMNSAITSREFHYGFGEKYYFKR